MAEIMLDSSLTPMTSFQLSEHFFIEMAAVLITCRLVSTLSKYLGQPPVVGEMIAGVVLGPSLIGAAFPSFQSWLFPLELRPVIFAVAQLGLVLYMFCVGLEFRVDLVRERWRGATAISLSGIVTPFLLGCGLAYPLVSHGGYFAKGLALYPAMAFLGSAMSITAFPMLARIIRERKLTGTSTGTLALAAGAIDDVSAWCILALVLAMLNGSTWLGLWSIGGGLLFILALTCGRPMLSRIGGRIESPSDHLSSFGIILILLMICAWFTDFIQLYAVFGAFSLGVALPRRPFSKYLASVIEPATTMLLLPLFFIYSGLNTRFGLLSSGTAWLFAVAIIIAAVTGKAGACFIAARLSGEPTKSALGIGILMNARGLMELIILNIGLERGIITPTLFTLLVLMAIVTTLIATPLFNLVQRHKSSPDISIAGFVTIDAPMR